MSLLEYHTTTTKELVTVNDRVRNLVSHWGEDGRYKEVVLKKAIKKFLPSKFHIGTGFVIKQTDVRGEHLSSRQMDLIIYENSGPVLFQEEDFVILTPDCIRGIIEVKANSQNQILSDIVRRANENGQFILSGKTDKKQIFFNGIFSYNGFEPAPNCEIIRDHVQRGNEPFINEVNFNEFKVNHISFNKDLFLKYWPKEQRPHSVYNIHDLSFSFFISNLIDYLASKSVRRNSFIWFASDKELDRMCHF